MARLQILRPAIGVGWVIVAAGVSAFGQAAPVPIAPAPLVAAQPAEHPATQTAAHSLLKVDGISGESTDPAHLGWIEIVSAQWGIRAGGATGRAVASRAGAGAGAISSLTITKRPDKSSLALHNAVAQGKSIKTVVLELTSHTKGEYYQATMSDVLVSSFQNTGVATNHPSESITFNFSKIEYKFGTIDAQNKRGVLGAVPAGWDVRLVVPD